MGRPGIPLAKIDQIRRAVARGIPIATAAGYYQVSRQTIYKYLRKEVTHDSTDSVADLHAGQPGDVPARVRE